MKKQITFLFGLPCSGKSTWYEENKERFQGFEYICADEIKKELPGYKETIISMYKDKAIDIAGERVREAVDKGANIILDGGGINSKYTMNLMTYAKVNGYQVTLVNVDTPYHVCIDRNSKRTRKVPEPVIAYKAFRRSFKLAVYEKSGAIDQVINVPYFTEKHVFFDMDGVLAAQSSLPVVNGKIDFVNSRYFRHLPVVGQVKDIVKLIHGVKDREVYILSAAPTSISMQEKLEWLEENFPFIKKENIFFVNAGQYKAEMFSDLATKLKLDKKDMCLVEDTHHIIKLVRQKYLMHSIHVSELLSKYGKYI